MPITTIVFHCFPRETGQEQCNAIAEITTETLHISATRGALRFLCARVEDVDVTRDHERDFHRCTSRLRSSD